MNIFKFFMKKQIDYRKEQYRGTLKQVMKVRGLRSISIYNYFKWKYPSLSATEMGNIHSLKLDLQDGYINAYAFSPNGRCGDKIEDVSVDDYCAAMNTLNDILADETLIPYKVRKNILVKLSR